MLIHVPDAAVAGQRWRWAGDHYAVRRLAPGRVHAVREGDRVGLVWAHCVGVYQPVALRVGVGYLRELKRAVGACVGALLSSYPAPGTLTPAAGSGALDPREAGG